MDARRLKVAPKTKDDIIKAAGSPGKEVCPSHQIYLLLKTSAFSGDENIP
jgi:hypothetical protein